MAITRNPVEVLDVLSDPIACQILERTYVANNDGVEGHVIANHANLREQNVIEKKIKSISLHFSAEQYIMPRERFSLPLIGTVDLTCTYKGFAQHF